MTDRRASTKQAVAPRVLLAIAGCLGGVILGEVALRIGEKVASRYSVGPGHLFQDPRLGKRVAPFAAGCDARGYRNREALQRAEIVAIGDSQTWGVNASPVEAWPARLQALTGSAVYNMSGGGFGMVQYVAMLDEASSLRPRLVVIGLYLGNDLYDAYKAAYSLPAWGHLRLGGRPDLMVDSVAPKADKEWNDEKAFHQAYGRQRPATWGLWLRGHMAVGRLVERAGLWPGGDAWFEIGRAWALAHPESGGYYDDGTVRTVFTVGYRAVAVDPGEPRIQEGVRLTSELLAQVRARCEQKGAGVLLLLIPTKERVFAGVLRERATLTEAHSRLARNEDSCRQAVIAAARLNRVPTLDLLGPLETAVAGGQQIYPTSIESHPNPLGYDLIARTVAGRVR